MKRRRLFVIFAILAVVVSCFPTDEYTFEFDGINFRLRSCTRYRSWLFGFVLWQRCSSSQEHATAVRLRELGVLPPIREDESEWLLMAGFKSGVRGWRGPGRDYVRALGATTIATPVTLPAEEDLTKNVWVLWAGKDFEGAKQFWQEFYKIATADPSDGAYYLWRPRNTWRSMNSK